MMQFFCLHLDRTQDSANESNTLPPQYSEENSGTKLSRMMYNFQTRPFLNLIAYDLMLIVAQFGNVSIFRGLWNMIDAFVWPGMYRQFSIYSRDILGLIIPNNKTVEH